MRTNHPALTSHLQELRGIVKLWIQIPIDLVWVRQRAFFAQFGQMLAQFGAHGFQLVVVARPRAH